MVTYVLDASAVLRYLDGEEGSVRVADILKDHIAGRHKAVISSVQWGEIAGVIAKVHGRDAVNRVLARLLAFGMEIVPVTAERAVRAALHVAYRRDRLAGRILLRRRVRWWGDHSAS